jgi:acetylornithine/succinyldiaminopimelate/putrescine aminotransferase
MPDGFVHVPYDNIDAIKEATNERTCAVLLEPIQGEGGVIVPDDGYLRQVREWCTQQNLLLILDEVQTGIGRTGTLFAYEQAGIEPDVLVLGKGLANGVPIGAIVAQESASVFEPGDHGSTFGGNPLACAAGVATVSYILENDVLSNVVACGEQLHKGLYEMQRTYFFVNGTRGRGLLRALDFQLDLSETVIQAAIEEGLLLNAPRPNILRFMPALTIQARQITFAIDVLERVMVWLDNVSQTTD